MSGVVSELRGRWDSSHAGLVPMVDVSPFGVVDGRQDFRGFVASDPDQLHMFKSGEVIGNADISYGHLARYFLKNGCVVENVVAVDAVIGDFTVADSSIVGCRFEGVDFSDQSFFNRSVVDGCEFVGCVAPEAFRRVAAVVDSVIVDTVIRGLGDVNCEQSPLLLRSRFETKMSNVTIWAHPEAQNLQGCDFSKAKWRNVNFEGVEFAGVEVPAVSRRFMVDDYPRWRGELVRLADEFAGDEDHPLSGVGKMMQIILGAEDTKLAAAGCSVPQVRYCWEADPLGEFKKSGAVRYREFFETAGITFE